MEALIAQLKDKDWKRRAAAVRDLGATRNPDAVVHLARAATDIEKRVRLVAISALASIGNQAAAEAMIDALDGSSAWLRPAVADALVTLPPKSLIRTPIAFRVLAVELNPRRKRRYERLVYNLARMGPVIAPSLFRLSEKGIKGVDGFALSKRILPDVMARMGTAVLPVVIRHLGLKPKRWGGPGIVAEFTLKRMGPTAAPTIARMLRRSGDPFIRMHLVMQLSQWRVAPAQRAVIAALKDKAPRVREEAARGLARNPTQEAFVALAQAVERGTRAERLAILESAEIGKGKRAISLVRLVFVHGRGSRAIAAAHALGALRDQGSVALLMRALQGHSNPRPVALKTAILWSLGRIKAPQSTALLARLSRRGPKRVRLAAIAALGSIGTKPARRHLKRLRRSRNKAIAKAAAAALASSPLGLFGDSTGVPECDALLKQAACYISKLPAAKRPPVLRNFKQTATTARSLPQLDYRRRYAGICRLMHGALKKKLAKESRFRSCR